MKRTKHSLSHYKLMTLKMGELVPVACFEVLPGDSVQQATSCLLRCAPMLAPVMHPVSVRIHHWFVPHRLVWEDWEPFITGGTDGEGDGAVYPTITANFAAGALGDYFGIPPGVAGLEVSAMPFRAYNLIFNENYRDQDLVTELVVPTAGGADSTSPVVLQSIAWEKDQFTSARPWPQKGPDVTLPLGTSAPVKGLGVVKGTANIASGSTIVNTQGIEVPPGIRMWATSTANAIGIFDKDNSAGNAGGTHYPDIYADLSAATAVTVDQVREAFALQRYQEARAQFGSRYTEYLRYLGVRSSDARLQRPEYLGGGKQTIAFTEVLQTGPDSTDDGVANLKGHGIAALRSRRYRRFFEEHGHVISLMSVRPRTMYANGLDRSWSRRTKEDYWQKELELIGQQEILNREVYAAGGSPTGVFGYQNRYFEYRHLQSQIAGDFRSSLNFWHLARIFGSAPALNADFVECDPSPRIFAEQTADNLWCMISNSVQARRMVGSRTIGRIM